MKPKSTVLDHKRHMVTINQFLSPEECADWIAHAEGIGFSEAPITTPFGFVSAPETRNNTRVMFDDVVRAKFLWERVEQFVPKTRQGAKVVGLNERFRIYKYQPGQYFKWHVDGAFERNSHERSLITLMIYLNKVEKGGAIEFLGVPGVTEVKPDTGLALLFQHHIKHQGAPVEAGIKYALRSDIMYRWTPTGDPIQDLAQHI